MKLNLGSGKRPIADYENIDVVKHTPNTIVGDILHLDYSNNSIEKIFNEHVIEHLDKPELDKFFNECNRMLMVGGELELIAPDFLKVIDKYKNKEFFGPHVSTIVDVDFLDDFLYGPHRHLYDYHKQSIYKKKLERLCTKYNFEILNIWFQDRPHSDNEICLLARKVR